MLLTYQAYQDLLGNHQVLDRLAEPAGVEDIDLPIRVSADIARPADFE